jgi:preprotein translocase subunit Sss1
MTATEQVWFIVGISGFLIFFENAIIEILKSIYKLLWRKPWKDEWNNTTKVIAGIIIFGIALYKLFTLPT